MPISDRLDDRVPIYRVVYTTNYSVTPIEAYYFLDKAAALVSAAAIADAYNQTIGRAREDRLVRAPQQKDIPHVYWENHWAYNAASLYVEQCWLCTRAVAEAPEPF